MEDATAYGGSQAPLNKKAWPKEEERKSAVSAYNKYFQSYHEDLHVFENHVDFRKKAKKKVAITNKDTQGRKSPLILAASDKLKLPPRKTIPVCKIFVPIFLVKKSSESLNK